MTPFMKLHNYKRTQNMNHVTNTYKLLDLGYPQVKLKCRHNTCICNFITKIFALLSKY